MKIKPFCAAKALKKPFYNTCYLKHKYNLSLTKIIKQLRHFSLIIKLCAEFTNS